jgi:hypothetical protein
MAATHLGWKPRDFWSATFFDFTSAWLAERERVDAIERAAKGGGKRAEMDVGDMLSAMAASGTRH